MKIGILTSGGDCAGLNSVMHGFVKSITAFESKISKVEILGISNGYGGLINGEYRLFKPEKFFKLLKIGGTILGTSRQPYKKLIQVTENDKAEKMRENYRKMGLDALIVLGGQGTHKTAAFLANYGLNVIALPKTIDNDIWGTDFTFGFHSAVNVATECFDRIQTTAQSHGRVMVVEIMGNKVGWLTLYSGIAGDADIILIPEIEYDLNKVIFAAKEAHKQKGFCIVAVAEGLKSTAKIAEAITEKAGLESRTVVPGHILRGGSPSAYDRVICTQMGAYAAELLEERKFGVTVALESGKIKFNNLADIAGKTKFVPPKHEIIRAAKDIGICFGD